MVAAVALLGCAVALFAMGRHMAAMRLVRRGQPDRRRVRIVVWPPQGALFGWMYGLPLVVAWVAGDIVYGIVGAVLAVIGGAAVLFLGYWIALS